MAETQEQFVVKSISELDDATYAGTAYVAVDDGTSLGKLPLSGIAPDKYTKPADGIPSTDMTDTVQASLGLANTAIQSAPSDGFYVCRGSTWVKVYDVTVTAIEGYPISDPDVYEKIGNFNGNLYPNVQVTVVGTATVGLYNYDELEYADELTLTDETQSVQLDVGGNYEIHAKGADGVVTVIVSADPFEEVDDDER